MSIDYLIKRVGILALVVVIAASVNFAVPRLVPGVNPVDARMEELVQQGGVFSEGMKQAAAAYKKQFGLDQPIWRQYVSYLGNLFRLNFGPSLAYFPTTVSSMIANALPWSIGLLGTATVLSFLIGSVLGALVGWPYSPKTLTGLVPSFFFFSAIPYFLLGLILIWLFAVELKILPPGGGVSANVQSGWHWSFVFNVLRHAILPALAIVVTELGTRALVMRGMILTLYGEDYVRYGEARGIQPRRLFVWYGMRNALLPQLTWLALQLGHLATGAVVVEIVFGYPGIGSVLQQALSNFDYNAIYGVVFILILGIAVATLIVDLLYPWLDPRIRYTSS